MKKYVSKSGPLLSYLTLGIGAASAAAGVFAAMFPAVARTDGNSLNGIPGMLAIGCVVLAIISLCKRAEKPVLSLIGIFAAFGGALGGTIYSALAENSKMYENLRDNAVLTGMGLIACVILFIVKLNTVPPKPAPARQVNNAPPYAYRESYAQPPAQPLRPQPLRPQSPKSDKMSLVALILGGSALAVAAVTALLFVISIAFQNRYDSLRSVEAVTTAQRSELNATGFASVGSWMFGVFCLLFQIAFSAVSLGLAIFCIVKNGSHKKLAVIGCILAAVALLSAVPLMIGFNHVHELTSIF